MLRRQVVRHIFTGVGLVSTLMFLGGTSGSVWFLTLGLFALFLGITDYGRQCPLILSVRHLAYRIGSKGKPPIVSAKPIKEANKGDH